jgi:cytochrome c oxidase assembly factor CtaG
VRTTLGTILVVLGFLVAAPAVAAYALVGQVTDEQTYLDAVTPLADDPAIQQSVAGQITKALTDKGLPESAQPLVQKSVDSFVASPDFKELWVSVNKEAHPEVLAMLRGEQGGSLAVKGDAIVLDLGDVAAKLKQRMAAEGVPLAEQIPPINASVQLISKPAVRQLVPAFDLLEKLSVLLPVLTIVFLLGGVVLSARRGRTMVVGGIGLVVMMLVLVLFLFLARSEVTARSGQPELAGAFYDALTNQAMVIAWIVCAVGGVAVVAGGFLAAAQSRRLAAEARSRRQAERAARPRTPKAYGGYGDRTGYSGRGGGYGDSDDYGDRY